MISPDKMAEIDQQLEVKEIAEVEPSPEDMAEITGPEVTEIKEEPEEKQEIDTSEETNVFAGEGVPVADDMDVQAILNKVYSTTELKFMYREPTGDLDDVLVYMKDNLRHLVFNDLQVTSEYQYYSDIYLDTEKKIATAYCMNRLRCGKDFDIPFDMPYSMFVFDTPVDWGKKIPKTARVTGTTQIMKHDSMILEFNLAGAVKMWVFDYNKIPARVEYQGKTYTYEILSTVVKEAEVKR
ncbi:hypothetical protein KY326_02755 [Candidatus Woesearchaeota archaeon]|nr:hypothetical protein [Candidatus Woesearchaeota archaeon]